MTIAYWMSLFDCPTRTRGKKVDTHLASPQNIIRASYAELTPKQRQLAQLVLNNPYTIAFESANELASQLKVSPATVVRFSQSLGYSGYPEFQGAVRAHLPTSLTAAERGARDLAEEESVPARVLARVFNAERISIQRVEEEIDPEHTSAAAQILADARSVLVLGPGVCVGVATHFAHSLQIMGIDATLITAGGIPLAVELIKLDEQDVLVTFGVWRYVKSVVNATILANKRGARCIAITDSPISPLATRADYIFITPTEGVAHTLPLSGMTTMANALLVMLSHLRPDETLQALNDVDAAYRFGDLLLSD